VLLALGAVQVGVTRLSVAEGAAVVVAEVAAAAVGAGTCVGEPAQAIVNDESSSQQALVHVTNGTLLLSAFARATQAHLPEHGEAEQ